MSLPFRPPGISQDLVRGYYGIYAILLISKYDMYGLHMASEISIWLLMRISSIELRNHLLKICKFSQIQTCILFTTSVFYELPLI